MATTILPNRKPGLRKNRPAQLLDGGNTPAVSPAQDPGVQATPGAFGEFEANAVQGAGQDIQSLAQKMAADDARLLKAQARRQAKQDNNRSLLLVDEFKQAEQSIFDDMVTDNKLGDEDFNDLYSQAVDKKSQEILDNANFSSPEAKLDFQGRLIEARLKQGDSRAVDNAAKVEERQMGIARNRLREFQLSQDRIGEGFSRIVSGASDLIQSDFGDLLSESNEKILLNEVVIEQFEPQLKALLAGGDTTGAHLLMENFDVQRVLQPQQWRANKQRIELVENKITEKIVQDNVLFQQAADRLNKPVTQLTSAERADALAGKDASFKGRQLMEEAKIIFKTDTPTSDQLQQTARMKSGAEDPNKAMRDVILVDNAKTLNFLSGEGRAQAEENLQAISLGLAALNARNEKGERAFEPGALAPLRTGISKTLKLMGLSQDQIDSLPFKLGDATKADLLSKSLATLALNQAAKIARTTNMSLTLVMKMWGTIGSTPEGLEVILNLGAEMEKRQLLIADLADRERNKIINPETATKEDFAPFNEKLAELKADFGEKLEAKIEAQIEKAQASIKQTSEKKTEVDKTSEQDKALAGKPFAQGSKILGVVEGGRVEILKQDGTKSTVPRENVDRFMQRQQEVETAPETPETSETPETPETSETPEAPEAPEPIQVPETPEEEEDNRTAGEIFNDVISTITEFFGGSEVDREKELVEEMKALDKKQRDLQKRTSEFLKLRPKDQSPEKQEQLNKEGVELSLATKKALKEFEKLQKNKKPEK